MKLDACSHLSTHAAFNETRLLSGLPSWGTCSVLFILWSILEISWTNRWKQNSYFVNFDEALSTVDEQTASKFLQHSSVWEVNSIQASEVLCCVIDCRAVTGFTFTTEEDSACTYVRCWNSYFVHLWQSDICGKREHEIFCRLFGHQLTYIEIYMTQFFIMYPVQMNEHLSSLTDF